MTESRPGSSRAAIPPCPAGRHHLPGAPWALQELPGTRTNAQARTDTRQSGPLRRSLTRRARLPCEAGDSGEGDGPGGALPAAGPPSIRHTSARRREDGSPQNNDPGRGAPFQTGTWRGITSRSGRRGGGPRSRVPPGRRMAAACRLRMPAPAGRAASRFSRRQSRPWSVRAAYPCGPPEAGARSVSHGPVPGKRPSRQRLRMHGRRRSGTTRGRRVAPREGTVSDGAGMPGRPRRREPHRRRLAIAFRANARILFPAAMPGAALGLPPVPLAGFGGPARRRPPVVPAGQGRWPPPHTPHRPRPAARAAPCFPRPAGRPGNA
jgi:hypothetical protein